MDINYKKSIFSTLLLITITLVVYFLIRGINSIFTTESTPSPTPTATVLPSEFPDYEAYKSMTKRLALTEGLTSYSPKGKPIIGRITNNLVISGKFSRIYLYIEASVDSGKPLTQWDSLYMAFDTESGHLFRSQSLKVPGDTITRLLYGLNQVPVLTSLPYSENKTPITLNWFNNFENDTVRFDAFLSSLRSGGKLNLVELRFECEADSDCSIQIKK